MRKKLMAGIAMGFLLQGGNTMGAYGRSLIVKLSVIMIAIGMLFVAVPYAQEGGEPTEPGVSVLNCPSPLIDADLIDAFCAEVGGCSCTIDPMTLAITVASSDDEGNSVSASVSASDAGQLEGKVTVTTASTSVVSTVPLSSDQAVACSVELLATQACQDELVPPEEPPAM